MARKILIGSGFKMRKSIKDSVDYTKKISNFIKNGNSDLELIEVFILASFLALYPMSKIISRSKLLKLGTQNCWHEDRGPYTGEVSPVDLKEIGCTYVMVGHSERRDIFREDQGLINKKIKACIRNNLKPILFIGEKNKYKNEKQVYRLLKNQLLIELNGINKPYLSEVVIAYEPVWAIGTEDAAPIEYIKGSLIFLREFLKKENGQESKNQSIIYGRSVKIDNIFVIVKIEGYDSISV